MSFFPKGNNIFLPPFCSPSTENDKARKEIFDAVLNFIEENPKEVETIRRRLLEKPNPDAKVEMVKKEVKEVKEEVKEEENEKAVNESCNEIKSKISLSEHREFISMEKSIQKGTKRYHSLRQKVISEQKSFLKFIKGRAFREDWRYRILLKEKNLLKPILMYYQGILKRSLILSRSDDPSSRSMKDLENQKWWKCASFSLSFNSQKRELVNLLIKHTENFTPLNAHLKKILLNEKGSLIFGPKNRIPMIQSTPLVSEGDKETPENFDKNLDKNQDENQDENLDKNQNENLDKNQDENQDSSDFDYYSSLANVVISASNGNQTFIISEKAFKVIFQLFFNQTSQQSILTAQQTKKENQESPLFPEKLLMQQRLSNPTPFMIPIKYKEDMEAVYVASPLPVNSIDIRTALTDYLDYCNYSHKNNDPPMHCYQCKLGDINIYIVPDDNDVILMDESKDSKEAKETEVRKKKEETKDSKDSKETKDSKEKEDSKEVIPLGEKVLLKSRLQFQFDYGFEVPGVLECSQWWLSCHLSGCSSIALAHIDARDGSLIYLERKTKDQLRGLMVGSYGSFDEHLIFSKIYSLFLGLGAKTPKNQNLKNMTIDSPVDEKIKKVDDYEKIIKVNDYEKINTIYMPTTHLHNSFFDPNCFLLSFDPKNDKSNLQFYQNFPFPLDNQAVDLKSIIPIIPTLSSSLSSSSLQQLDADSKGFGSFIIDWSNLPYRPVDFNPSMEGHLIPWTFPPTPAPTPAISKKEKESITSRKRKDFHKFHDYDDNNHPKATENLQLCYK